MLNMKGKNERREGPDVPDALRERSTAEDGNEIAAFVNQFSVRLLLQLLKRLGTPPARVSPPSFILFQRLALLHRGHCLHGAAVDRRGERHVPDRLGKRRAALARTSRLDELQAHVVLVASTGGASEARHASGQPPKQCAQAAGRHLPTQLRAPPRPRFHGALGIV